MVHAMSRLCLVGRKSILVIWGIITFFIKYDIVFNSNFTLKVFPKHSCDILAISNSILGSKINFDWFPKNPQHGTELYASGLYASGKIP